jgi:hypothetical protein
LFCLPRVDFPLYQVWIYFGELTYIYRAFHNVLWDYKNHYWKTIERVFTKPAQIEGITEKKNPSTLFFFVVHISAARGCECM